MQQTNVEAFDNWMLWKSNAYKLTDVKRFKRHSETVTAVCTEIGLRPVEDYQVSMYEVRFKTKTFLAMFKMNFNNG